MPFFDKALILDDPSLLGLDKDLNDPEVRKNTLWADAPCLPPIEKIKKKNDIQMLLVLAAQQGKCKILEKLIQFKDVLGLDLNQGYTINLQTPSPEKDKPQVQTISIGPALYVACAEGQVEAVKLLIEASHVDLEAKSYSGAPNKDEVSRPFFRTPLQIAEHRIRHPWGDVESYKEIVSLLQSKLPKPEPKPQAPASSTTVMSVLKNLSLPGSPMGSLGGTPILPTPSLEQKRTAREEALHAAYWRQRAREALTPNSQRPTTPITPTPKTPKTPFVFTPTSIPSPFEGSLASTPTVTTATTTGAKQEGSPHKAILGVAGTQRPKTPGTIPPVKRESCQLSDESGRECETPTTKRRCP